MKIKDKILETIKSSNVSDSNYDSVVKLLDEYEQVMFKRREKYLNLKRAIKENMRGIDRLRIENGVLLQRAMSAEQYKNSVHERLFDVEEFLRDLGVSIRKDGIGKLARDWKIAKRRRELFDKSLEEDKEIS